MMYREEVRTHNLGTFTVKHIDIIIMVKENAREKLLLQIQDEVLKGGICFDDYTSFQLENAYISFCAGADLACVIMCQAAIESYIKEDEALDCKSFYDIIENCSYSSDFKNRLHPLRKYRNKWMHRKEIDREISMDYAELEREAISAYRLTLEVFHYYPFI